MTMTAVRPALSFRPDIEGLRGLAVLLVVLGHAGVTGLGLGYLGVDVLLVVSGFLVTRSLLTEVDSTGGVSLVRWYGRRARRILPAAVVVVVAVVLAGRLLATGVVPVQHVGVLAVAGVFPLVWPAALVLLLWLGFRWALPWFVGAAVVASFAYAACDVWPAWPALTRACLTRAWEPGAGCLLAFAAGRLRRVPAVAGIGLALLVVTAPTVTEATPVWVAVVPVLATVLVLAGRADALLGRGPWRWLGRLSHPFYLWHWPVLVFAEQVHGGPLPAGGRAVSVLVALVLAAATYAAVEQPVRRGHLATGAVALLMIGAPFAVVHAQR